MIPTAYFIDYKVCQSEHYERILLIKTSNSRQTSGAG
jgi:hypothetical protein